MTLPGQKVWMIGWHFRLPELVTVSALNGQKFLEFLPYLLFHSTASVGRTDNRPGSMEEKTDLSPA